MIARILTAAAASALLTGAAYAQTPPTMPQNQNDVRPTDRGAQQGGDMTNAQEAGSMQSQGATTDPAMPGSMQNQGAMQNQGTMQNPGAMSGATMSPSTMSPGATSANMAGQNASMDTSPAVPGVGPAVVPTASGAAAVITNGPIPDTAETRRMYRPLSNAGRRSTPQGN